MPHKQTTIDIKLLVNMQKVIVIFCYFRHLISFFFFMLLVKAKWIQVLYFKLCTKDLWSLKPSIEIHSIFTLLHFNYSTKILSLLSKHEVHCVLNGSIIAPTWNRLWSLQSLSLHINKGYARAITTIHSNGYSGTTICHWHRAQPAVIQVLKVWSNKIHHISKQIVLVFNHPYTAACKCVWFPCVKFLKWLFQIDLTVRHFPSSWYHTELFHKLNCISFS